MNKEQFLLQLAGKYGTDKLGHGYIPHYAQYLPDTCSSLLEIGCYKGASLKMWDEFYGQDCDIHTIDLFGEPGLMSIRECRRLEFVPHQGDQKDISFLATIKPQFDVIIDDGSHNSYDQIVSFKHLFLNNLKPNGLYIIEDLHCCNDSFYWNNGINIFADTILWTLKNYEKEKTFLGKMFSQGETEVFDSIVNDIKVFDDKIAFIWKK